MDFVDIWSPLCLKKIFFFLKLVKFELIFRIPPPPNDFYLPAPECFYLELLKIFLTLVLFRNDKKMDRLLTGVGDGCDSCLTPRHLWTDEDTIEKGFPRNRTFENIKETWASLTKRKDGEVFKSTGDYETRQGLCREPVTLRETFSFTITHKVSFLCSISS